MMTKTATVLAAATIALGAATAHYCWADALDHYRPAVLQQAERALERQQPDQALERLDDAEDRLTRVSDRDATYRLSCAAHYQAGAYLDAERYCDLAVQTGRLSSDELNNRGVMRFELGRYREAAHDFSRAAQTLPRNPEARSNLAAARAAMARYGDRLESRQLQAQR